MSAPRLSITAPYARVMKVGDGDYSRALASELTKGPSNPVLSLRANGLDSVSIGDTIGAYIDGARYRIDYGSEKNVPPYFRGASKHRSDAPDTDPPADCRAGFPSI